MNEHGWISIHEQEPPENPVNPANSVQVLWCDAETDFQDYAQHVGTYWFPRKTTPGMFDSGASGCMYIQDTFDRRKRDLYWKHLDPTPKPVKR
jgi:hypothetical protein